MIKNTEVKNIADITVRWAIPFILFVAGIFPGLAQEPLAEEEREMVVAAITEPWEEWESLSLSGKLKMAGLPLNPSVKIYMRRDSSVFISLRAPLMGEVGRAEIMGDSLLVVNKMKKTYVRESLEGALSYYPGSLSDIQDLLLGRVVIPGFGLLSHENPEVAEIYPEEDGEYSLIPSQEAELEKFNYGYLIDECARPKVLLVIPVGEEDVSVSLTYEYFDKGYDIFASYQSPKKIYSGTLELGLPDSGGSPIEPIRLNGRYQRQTFSQFMKSF